MRSRLLQFMLKKNVKILKTTHSEENQLIEEDLDTQYIIETMP